MTALNKQTLRSKVRSASAGEWIKESGDGWEAICSADDQANGNFIIAHFEGPDAQANREFVQAANPDTVLAMLDELEAAEKRIAELREWNVGLAQESFERQQRIVELQISRDKCFKSGLKTGWEYGIADDTEGYNREIADAQAVIDSAAGIGVKGE